MKNIIFALTIGPHLEGGLTLVVKVPKRQILRDIEKLFQEVTPIGLEPYHFFSFENILTNTVARGIQSFRKNGLWLVG